MDHDAATASPFPLDGGRVGVGGAYSGLSEGGAQGSARARDASLVTSGDSTPAQPSPIEGESSSRFAREDKASEKAVRRARRLRKTPTWTEARLWDRLRLLPLRVRRQAPVGPYVADFICHRAALVIEVDGDIHQWTDVALRDLIRDAWFETQGYVTLRVLTREVEADLDGVIERISTVISNRVGKVI